MKKALVISACFILSGCYSYEEHLKTEFLTPVCIKPFVDYKYKTCGDIRFKIDEREFLIPSDFVTDLASVPKIAWPIMSPFHASLIKPAIVHDWFYRKTCDFTRIDADTILKHMLKNNDVAGFKVNAIFYAVRLFGWNYYNEDYCDG